ncbi:MAG: cytidylate kinase family protein [Terriglobia bacterium]
MSVITISRGSFSGGKTLAECLADKLGYRCIGRETIVERAAASGVSHEELLAALLKPPGFLERFQHKRYQYLTLFQAALAEEVKDGKVVYHGNAGHLMLKGAAPVLRIRIIAPIEMRLAMVQERLKLTGDEALDYIRKMDEGRKRWTQFLYGVDWEDPALYDLVLNLEHMDIEEACEVIDALARTRKCFELTPECRAELGNLAVAGRVRAALVMNSRTSHLEVEANARGGHVSIRGKVTDTSELVEVRRVAMTVPGVTGLDLDELTPTTRA